MIWLTFIFFEIARNYFLIEALEIRPHYGWSKIIRFFGGIGFLFAKFPDPASTPFPAIVYALFQISSFYILFDLLLNFARGKRWDYRGKESGSLDKLPNGKYHLLKAGTFIIMILSLFAMYGR